MGAPDANRVSSILPVPMTRREHLAYVARLAGGVVAGSLYPGRSRAAGPVCSIKSDPGPRPEADQACLKPGWRAGYYQTVWPSEHTDLWRSHAVFDAGLPADVAHRQLRVSTASLDLPVWGYTRASHQVFAIGGSPFLLDFFTTAIEKGPVSTATVDLAREVRRHGRAIPYVAEVDTRTMQVRRFEMRLGHTLNYTGGLLMHQNGFVYAVAQSVLYKIDLRSMKAVRSSSSTTTGPEAEGAPAESGDSVIRRRTPATR
jgi:hypothetical protein